MDKRKIYVGNLPWSIANDALGELFAEFGEIEEAIVITDRMSGRSKGFGFVTFTSDDAAQAAVDAMHEKEVDGRNIVVNIARPKVDR